MASEQVTPSELPFAPACERNKQPILSILEHALAGCRRVLEIGSGTGQHAVFLARHLPHLEWQPTDLAPSLPGLRARIALEGPPNVRPPLELDVREHPWAIGGPFDAAFSANTVHIMGWEAVESLFRGIDGVLAPRGTLCIYGPFRYGGRFTTESNAAFDRELRQRDPASGIRDFEAVDALAARAGLRLAADHAMPANNQLLVWTR